MVVKNKAKSKVKKSVPTGVVMVISSFNNTMVAITDLNGDVISWATGGSAGFKGSRKSTPFAAQKAMEIALEKAIAMGLKTVMVKVKGPGSGRDSAIRVLSNYPINVTAIKDITPLPHNGCRPPKRKRV